MTARNYFQLQFEAPAPFESVRAWCAEAVRLARPSVWTWLFTGSAEEGAIVTSRLEAPFDLRGPSLETHVLFLGDVEQKRGQFVDRGHDLLTPVEP